MSRYTAKVGRFVMASHSRDKDISMTGAYPMSEFLKIPAEL